MDVKSFVFALAIIATILLWWAVSDFVDVEIVGSTIDEARQWIVPIESSVCDEVSW